MPVVSGLVVVNSGAVLGATTVNEKFFGPTLPALLLTEIARVDVPSVVVLPLSRPEGLKVKPAGIPAPDQVNGVVPLA